MPSDEDLIDKDLIDKDISAFGGEKSWLRGKRGKGGKTALQEECPLQKCKRSLMHMSRFNPIHEEDNGYIHTVVFFLIVST